MEILKHFSSAFTVVSFVSFIAIVAWAYSKGAKRGFESAAQLPFEDSTSGRFDGKRSPGSTQ
ncbi:MAG TPA: cbb3-type cytochrome c oxidase subunit 3 [Burkholderiaceae bacterium]|nr:cbb3-type cytochrome c oxidase subunit 3 [Burkholderiaceae bacterium]